MMTMPGHDDMAAAAELELTQPLTQQPPPLEQRSRPRMSRRVALRSAATTGVAVTALAATASPALASRRPARADGDDRGHEVDDRGHDVAEQSETDPGEPIIVHLRDARSGEIDLFRGTSRVRLRDRSLAALLVRKSR
jgi:hypothetical protein